MKLISLKNSQRTFFITFIFLSIISVKLVNSDEINLSLSSPDGNSDNSTDFVATKEWQEIKPGEK